LAERKDKEFELFMLDHDLSDHGPSKLTGMDVVRFIVRNRIKVKRVIVHSTNEPAAMEMVKTLISNGYSAIYMLVGGES